jgi:hypothetical protein
MTDPRAILAFMTAGKATLTLQNAETGNRFTYRVKFAPKRTESDPDTWFVQLLNGPDNTKNYIYIGILRKEKGVLQYIWTSKARVGRETPSVKAFQWALTKFVVDSCPDTLEVYHAGKCGRCGRKLTVPESISSGFGPECINLVGFAAVSQIVASGEAAEQKQLNFTAPTLRNRFRTELKIGGRAAAQAMYAPASSPTPVGAVTTADGGSFLDRAVPQKEHSVEVAIEQMIEEYKATAPENYYQDGELTETEARKVAYNKFRVQLQRGNGLGVR